MKISYGKSVHGREEIAAVVKVLQNSTQMGKNVSQLEKKIAKMFNKKFGIMLNSASSALFIAFESINIQKGSEIITPALTFGTTVSSIIKNGFKPVFVDVKANTFCINEDLIEKAITKKTKAICVPNLIGNLPDWNKLSIIAKKYNLFLIEDSADTLGAKIDGKTSGIYSDISITSFYGSHIINGAGNGGMLCINDKKIYKKSLLLRSWGRSSSLYKEGSEKIENRFNVKIDGIDYDKKFIFDELGYNLEPSELSAAFALVQLSKLKENIKKRERNFNYHINFFKKYEDFFILPDTLRNVKTPWLAFALIIKDRAPFNRKKMQIFLEKNNIQTRVVFTGNILRQPCMKNSKIKVNPNNFPHADLVMRGGLLLGCHQGLKKKDLDYLHGKVKEFLSK
ncbi:DegT/DnrJ/EryC1/StrS family aminotransferase [Candidatus Pelagibacter sp. HIMB1695]|uniref:DegT/DnrJ/EryC1/StrS family aminotransferase n=1 Tax=Candidatus Pelagibacter sp. HIMB1695 TaxID=3413364 RepID=UPI003F8480A2